MSSTRNDRYTEIPTEPKESMAFRSDSVEESLYEFEDRRRGGSTFTKWLRENFLKVVQVIVLIDIAILLTIDVTATLAARVRHSKTCSHSSEHSKEEVSTAHSNKAIEEMTDAFGYTIGLEERPEWGTYEKPWNLPPSDELDAAWEDFLVAKNIRVSPTEFQNLNANLTSRVRLTDGDYVGVLGPYHLLHCLNILRRVVHQDYYYPRMSEKERNSFNYKHEHLDHCIESFRQSITCHGYPTFYTGEWVADSNSFPSKEIRPASMATCVDWKGLDGWARQRAIAFGQVKVRPGPFEKGHNKGHHDHHD